MITNNLFVIAAILGNWWGESNINPGIWEGLRIGSPGYGLGQWTDNSQVKRRTGLTCWLSQNGYAMDSAEGQIKFFVEENIWYSVRHAKQFRNLQEFLNSNSTDLEYLTYAFLEGWEGIWDGTQTNRYNHAQKIFYALLGGKQSTSGWVKGNRYLSEDEIINNAVLAAKIFRGETENMGYYISNCGGDERGQLSGGQAGDQTGTEWGIKPITDYRATFGYRFHYSDANVRKMLADLAVEAANNDLVGYDQGQRITFYQHLAASNWRPSQITIPCEADCSSGVAAIIKAVGELLNIQAFKNIDVNMDTRSAVKMLTAIGFTMTTDNVTNYAIASRGDIFLNCSDTGHHIVIYVGTNSDGSADEEQKEPNRQTMLYQFTEIRPGDMHNVDVLIVEEILAARGLYKGPLDWNYDLGRESIEGSLGWAIREFQRQSGLDIDGEVGRDSFTTMRGKQPV
jgi:hypothetical protein